MRADEITKIFRSLDEARHAWLVLRRRRVDLAAIDPAERSAEAVLQATGEDS